MNQLLLQIRLGALFLALLGAMSFAWATWKTPDIPRAIMLSYAPLVVLVSAYGIFIGLREKRYLPWLGNALTIIVTAMATTGLALNGPLTIGVMPALIAGNLLLSGRRLFVATTLWMLGMAAYVLFWKAAAPEIPFASRSWLSATVVGVIGLSFYAFAVRYVKEMQDAQAELERAQAVAHVGSFSMLDMPERFRCSKEAARLFDLEASGAFTVDEWLARVHADDRDAVEAAWRAALQGRPFEITYRITARNRVTWIRALADLEFDPQGRLAGATGTVQDVTDQRILTSDLE